MKNKKLLNLVVFACFSLSSFAQFPIVLEAEDAQHFGSLQVLDHSGFSGGKYVHEFLINTDSYYIFDNVEIPKAGTYELKAYTTGSSRPFSVKVNGYERKIVWTKDSSNWNEPPTSTVSTYIYMDAGVNILRIGSEYENGPNIDKFEIYQTTQQVPQPGTVTMAYVYDFTDDAIITAEHPNESLSNLTDNDETTFYRVEDVSSTTITVDCGEPKVITSMLLAAGRGVDVSGWKVQYSTDGTTWRDLTSASSKMVGMGDLTLFSYNRSASNFRNYAAQYYRLTATGDSQVDIAEWQLFGMPYLNNSTPFPEDITENSTTSTSVTGSPEGGRTEGLVNLFDRKVTTKYCCTTSSNFYVQYVLDKAYKISSYSVTSAGDASERDPKLWSFSGYNPEEGWIELDEQRDFKFPDRYTTMEFKIDSDKEFTAFMLEVSNVKAGSMVQLLALQAFGEASGGPASEPVLPGDPSGDPVERAAELVRLMTKSEKLSYVGGVEWMYTRAIPRLGIPRMKMSDGPQGIGTWGKSTAYPAAVLLAATWNEDLAWSYGEALALDARARGVNILLGPGVNIYRAPMCGRNFEYMGEDPYLSSRTAVGYIKGLQENGVMAVIKHFTANYQEYNRNYISSDIDERTLNEIYFPAFRAAVQEAKVGSVMSSYNLLNGTWTTHHPWLLTTVLREQWGFDGILMSDWGSTHACLPAAAAGLDLEMASGANMSPDSLRYYINKGELDMETIDKKVQHILQTMIRFGFMDNEQLDPSIPTDNPYTRQTALNVAREGIVLLKNNDNVLPIQSDKISNVLVVGKNAKRYLTGGGSGRVDPISYVSLWDGMQALAAQKGVTVKYVDEYDHMDNVIYTSSTSSEKGFKGQYFNNTNLSGTPSGTRIDATIDFNFQNGANVGNIGNSNFSVRWTGELRPEESGSYTFTLGGDDGFRLYIDDRLVIDDWNAAQERYKTYSMNLTAGSKYEIKVEYYQGGGAAIIDFYWTKQGASDYFQTAMENADVVIACFGFDSSTEAEGGDRTFALPSAQKTFLDKVVKTSTPVVGIVSAGGNVEMQSWVSKLKGLLWTWYPGQEGGTALAEVLFGDVNPSGKLPITFEKGWAHNPTNKSYYDTDGDMHVEFTEGVFVGYRGYDKANRAVQYPFGYGMSYTTFSLSDMTIENTWTNNSIVQVACRIKNTGTVAGAEVVQLYVGKQGNSKVERPLKELKAFKKVYLEPGETKTVHFYLKNDAFSFYDVDETAFVVDEGLYEISLGYSSRDLVLQEQVMVTDYTNINEVSLTEQERLVPSVVSAGQPIRLSSGAAVQINVYNLSGTLVSSYENTDTINTVDLLQGLYIVRTLSNNKYRQGKFIVK